jgi:TolB protein
LIRPGLQVTLLVFGLALIAITGLAWIPRQGVTVPPSAWIAFEVWLDGPELYRMHPDGSGVQRLTYGGGYNWFPAWSPDGQWIVFAHGSSRGQLYRMRPDGSELQRLTYDDAYINIQPDWSPDSQWILYECDTDYTYSFCRIHPDGSGFQYVLDTPDQNRDPAWSPDGQWIVFSSNRLGRDTRIYRMRLDGSEVQRLTNGPSYADFDPDWSPDGQWIVFVSQERDTLNADLYRMHPDGSALQRLTDDPAHDRFPAWSPDGQWIAFTSDRDDQRVQIYRMRPDGSALQRLTSFPGLGGQRPAWSPPIQSSFHPALPLAAGSVCLAAGLGVESALKKLTRRAKARES